MTSVSAAPIAAPKAPGPAAHLAARKLTSPALA